MVRTSHMRPTIGSSTRPTSTMTQDARDHGVDQDAELEVQRLDGLAADPGGLVALEEQHQQRAEEGERHHHGDQGAPVRRGAPGALLGRELGRGGGVLAYGWLMPLRLASPGAPRSRSR